MSIVGGKWKMVILHHLIEGPKRYNELRKDLQVVTERTLSIQLKQLEKDGMVNRKVYGKKPPIKVVYSLTEFGKTFIPIMKAICNWGDQVVADQGEIITISDE
tara:strand:+ start:294 stop:602 length:309 start_codon:yes stop_codon:yes gene_type:complete